MCKYFSAILMRDGTVLTLDESSSHDDILTANNLRDVKLKDRDFIRIEITPREPINLFSKDRSDWMFREDEAGTLPSWYDEDLMALREKCWQSWESSIQRLIHDKIDVPKMLSLIDEVESINYMSNHAEPLPEWKLYDTRGAVGDAVGGAVRYAVWDAVEDAVEDAVVDVVRGAVWNAAWNAAWDAVWNAAWDAVRDAVWDIRLYTLINAIPNMNLEHIDYMNRRMEVWKRGYGCYCDIDGVLYCYKKV